MHYRSAIGAFNNFIKSKEAWLLFQFIKILRSLLNYFGVALLPMLSNMHYHVFILSLLLLISGNVKPNPGPVRFCHLNARSLLSGVDLNLHIASQHSLLDEIYETLVYRSDFEIIAICETWLKDSVPDTDLDLAGYQVPFYRHRGSRGGGGL